MGFLLRFRDPPSAPPGTAVEAHNQLFRQKGKVWLGKFGLPLTNATLQLSTQPGVQPKLILARPKAGAKDALPRIHIADIAVAQNARPPANLIPEYYRKQSDVGTWFCLSSQLQPLTDAQADRWVIVSSAQPLLLTVRRVARTFFIVCLEKDRPLAHQLLATIPRTGPASPQRGHTGKSRPPTEDRTPTLDDEPEDTFPDDTPY